MRARGNVDLGVDFLFTHVYHDIIASAWLLTSRWTSLLKLLV